MALGLVAAVAAVVPGPAPDPEGALEAAAAPGPEGAREAGAAAVAAEGVSVLVVTRGGRNGR